jgi:large subunit ribosomal protein L18
MNNVQKAQLLQKRKWRIRKKVNGTAARPRLSVKFSSKHIYAQLVNDDAGTTVAFLSSLDESLRKQNIKSNLVGAKGLAVAFADKVKAAGITSVVFDRNGRLYHGKVKAFADSLREAGLQF